MSKLILFLLACLASVNVAFTQSNVGFTSRLAQVGKQPIAIFPNKYQDSFDINPDTLNIICVGQDAGFDGKYNEGDELPSWWKIEGVINANPNLPNPAPLTIRKVMDLDANWTNLFPLRSRIVEQSEGISNALHANLLPIPSIDKVVFYDMSTGEPAIMDGSELGAVLDSNIKSVCTYGNFVFTTRREYHDPVSSWITTANVLSIHRAHGFDKLLSYESSNNMIQRVICYNNPVDNSTVVAVLYEEGMGLEGTLEFHTSKMPLSDMTAEMTWEDCFETKEIKVGVTINDMTLLKHDGIPYLFVVSNGDNRIYVVDGTTQEVDGQQLGIEDYITIPGNVGIREISFDADHNKTEETRISATISSYDGNLYYIDDIFNPDSEANVTFEYEGMSDASYLFHRKDNTTSKLFFARTLNYTDKSYQKFGNEVEIFYKDETGIFDNIKVNSLKMFPNPATSIVNIELPNDISDINSIHLIDNTGKYIQNINNYLANENVVQINVSGLKPSNYFIKLESKEGTYIQKFVIE